MNRDHFPGYPHVRSVYHERRRRVFEAFHDYRYSRPALFDMDRKLAAHLPSRPGFFVEAGANDGWGQSNTYYLERARGWHGLLVEPLAELASACEARRRRSIVESVALVADSGAVSSVEMTVAGLVSAIAPAGALAGQVTRRVATATLTQILTAHGVGEIDFMSLDMEGAELDALRGLDLRRYSPRYLLIEMLNHDRDRPSFDALLNRTHEFADMLSPHDVLFRRRTRKPGQIA